MAIDRATAATELERRMRHPTLRLTPGADRPLEQSEPLEEQEQLIELLTDHEARLAALESEPVKVRQATTPVVYDRFSGAAMLLVDAEPDDQGRLLYRAEAAGPVPGYVRRYPSELIETLASVPTAEKQSRLAFDHGRRLERSRLAHVAKQTAVALVTMACIWGAVAALQALAGWAN